VSARSTLRPAALRGLVLAAALGATGVLVTATASQGAGGHASAVAARPPVAAAPITRPDRPSYVPKIGHVFVINYENENSDETWGDTSEAPFLAKTLRRKGVLLTSYYGTAHNSLPNYLAQISGQAPNPSTQSDCQTYLDFTRTAPHAALEQAVGTGCVYPRSVKTLPRQLSRARVTWQAYLQDMPHPCTHPRLNALDPTQHARKGHNYAVRHNPFVYFHSIIDKPTYCAAHVKPLKRLTRRIAHARTTPRLAYITPDLCADGHDDPCADGRKGGLRRFDAFLRVWGPRILDSPAFRKDGMLVITADESETPFADSDACCDEQTGPNTTAPGILGPGGGKVGALVISRWTEPGTWSTTPYNHYSLLASLEELFRVPKIGMARQAGLPVFGLDVYNNGWWLH